MKMIERLANDITKKHTERNNYMKLTNLKQVNNSDFRRYLKDRYQLSDYQSNKMYGDDFPRHTQYYIFECEKVKNGGFLWRLTLPLIIPYFLLMATFVLFKWVITGNRYFGENNLKFHKFWMRKLGINWA